MRGKLTVMDIIKIAFVIALFVFAIVSVVYASVMQCVLSYEKYGFVFNNGAIFIPHKSAWWYLGFLGFPLAQFLCWYWGL